MPIWNRQTSRFQRPHLVATINVSLLVVSPRRNEASRVAQYRAMTQRSLIGTWKLLSFQTHGEDGSIHYVFGPDAEGYVTYGHDGYMHIAMMKAKRSKIAARELGLASAEEKALAAEEFTSYCGKYEIKGNRVIHYVEISLNPSFIGEIMERDVQLKDDELILTASPSSSCGTPYTHRLVWKRV
jgi:hypothetical protein